MMSISTDVARLVKVENTITTQPREPFRRELITSREEAPQSC